MTVESTAFYTDWYLANGTNKTWNYDFAILAESNITILVRDGTDDSTSVKYTNGFSFNPNSDYSAGTITFPATGDALAAGKQLRIVRSMDFLQTTEIGMEGNFSPILHERAFDKLTMQTQELKEGAERAIKVPLGFSGYELSSTFADYTTFMKLGDLIVPGPTAAQIQQAETSAEEAIAAKDAAETARDIAAGYAASINSVNFYTKIQIDDFRTADQTSAKNAGNLNAGIIPDACLPLSLQPLAQANVITDCNGASRNGWYAIESSGSNKPSSSGGYVFTIAKHTDWWVQYFFTQSEDAANQLRWRRYRAGSTWGPWVRIYEAEAELLALIDAQIAATVPASIAPNVQIFTSSGTYTKSSGLKWAKITVIGGGGGGKSSGGGGGGTAIKYASASEIGATNSVIVGAGGNADSNGGNSSINLGSVTVTGRGGDKNGYGGAGTNGTLNISGGHGFSDNCGGSTIFPGGGSGNSSHATANTGGGGGYGLSGGSGVVIIEEYF